MIVLVIKSYLLIWATLVQDRNGNMANGAIVNLVDEVGAAAAVKFKGQPMAVSVDMSVSFLSTAKVNVSKLLSDILIILSFLLQMWHVFVSHNINIRNS